MANKHPRRLQNSIRPLRSEYRVTRDSATGRMVYMPYNEMSGGDYLEIVCNIATCCLLSYGICLCVPLVNSSWPLAGIVLLVLCWWQNESITRWPVRFVAWGIFWGWLAL